MIIFAYILLISTGLMLDFYSCATNMPIAQWQECYSIVRDLQFIGFALLAFECCPYKRVELKVAAFFMALWRVCIAIINHLCIDPVYSPALAFIALSLYIVWIARATLMGEFKRTKRQSGAYYIFFPIHSVWGLLQAVFLPWYPARYESRMISDGKHTWCVRKKEFIKYENDILKIDNLDHVKVYLGRALNADEIMHLDLLQGTKVVPGWRDCREIPKYIGK